MSPIIALTMGDPNGIGPEIIVRALHQMQPFALWTPKVFGNRHILQTIAKQLQLPLEFTFSQEEAQSTHKIWVHETEGTFFSENNWQLGQLNQWGGEQCFLWIKDAIDQALAKEVHAICTAPICKEALHLAGYAFPGHTEILSYYTNRARPIMMLSVEPFKAIHLSTHMSLRNALDCVTQENILEVLHLSKKALQGMGFSEPRIAVPGLNPHASENGLFGHEEQTIIAPAIEQAQAEGIDCEGPISPDTVFLKNQSGEFDAVLALYHDQGHIPLKLMGMERGVNITLNLPIIRTSVDHGTAFELATQLCADPQSLITALQMAKQMATSST